MSLIIKAPVKINLALKIVGFDKSSNYHFIDTIFAFLHNCYDVLEIRKAKYNKIIFTGNDSEYIDNNNNLCTKAVQFVADILEQDISVDIKVTKNIPLGSGLGGGSSNAAAIIKALARIYNFTIDNTIINSSVVLGADVPAFLLAKNGLYTRYGDKFVQSIDLLKYKHCNILLIYPACSVSTQKIFLAYKNSNINNYSSKIKTTPFFLNQCSNDLYFVTKDLVPEIDECIKYLNKENNCLFAGMSGSGSSVFGIFESDQNIQNIVDDIRQFKPHWWLQQCSFAL